MKASKFLVLAGGILGLIAFFLPLVTVEHRGTKVSASAFDVVKGLGEVQAAVKSDEAKESIAAMGREGRKMAKDVDADLGTIKMFVFVIFVPALLLAVIGGMGVARKRFGRVAGTFSLLFGLIALGIGALLRAAASETGDSAGIAMTILLLTGLLGFIGGIMALVKPERAAAA